jgi:putative peptide zinc metalloprotease protein
MTEAEKRIGPRGAGTVASMLADLGDKGFLEGVDQQAEETAPESRLKKIFKPRDFSVKWFGPMFQRAYERGGWVLFSRPGLALLALIGVGGLAAWIYMIAGRYGTPFVVAKKVGLGGLVFMAGRFVVVAFHEMAHGLTVSSFGRRVPRAGIKLMMVFPYAFVDTSEAWFESRPRRLAISGAGPVSDFVVGGMFSFLALGIGNGTVRDVFFNLAMAAYVGGLFNLNPFLERDGYHMMVDVLREPGLRRRSRQWLVARLAGREVAESGTRAFRIYAIASVFWLLSGLIFAIIGTKRFYPVATKLAPREAVWAAFGIVYLIALLPLLLVVGKPLLARRRERAGPGEHAAA